MDEGRIRSREYVEWVADDESQGKGTLSLLLNLPMGETVATGTGVLGRVELPAVKCRRCELCCFCYGKDGRLGHEV